MPRSKVKKVLKAAKGYYGRGKSCYRIAKQRVMKAMQYEYISRKHKKRNMKKMWITKINAASRQHGLSYSRFAGSLTKLKIHINKKVLAQLAFNEPITFQGLVHTALKLDDSLKNHPSANPQIRSLQFGLIASTLGKSSTASAQAKPLVSLPIVRLGDYYASLRE
jgi:large subunit ribosomal protein L20